MPPLGQGLLRPEKEKDLARPIAALKGVLDKREKDLETLLESYSKAMDSAAERKDYRVAYERQQELEAKERELAELRTLREASRGKVFTDLVRKVLFYWVLGAYNVYVRVRGFFTYVVLLVLFVSLTLAWIVSLAYKLFAGQPLVDWLPHTIAGWPFSTPVILGVLPFFMLTFAIVVDQLWDLIKDAIDKEVPLECVRFRILAALSPKKEDLKETDQETIVIGVQDNVSDEAKKAEYDTFALRIKILDCFFMLLLEGPTQGFIYLVCVRKYYGEPWPWSAWWMGNLVSAFLLVLLYTIADFVLTIKYKQGANKRAVKHNRTSFRLGSTYGIYLWVPLSIFGFEWKMVGQGMSPEDASRISMYAWIACAVLVLLFPVIRKITEEVVKSAHAHFVFEYQTEMKMMEVLLEPPTNKEDPSCLRWICSLFTKRVVQRPMWIYLLCGGYIFFLTKTGRRQGTESDIEVIFFVSISLVYLFYGWKVPSTIANKPFKAILVVYSVVAGLLALGQIGLNAGDQNIYLVNPNAVDPISAMNDGFVDSPQHVQAWSTFQKYPVCKMFFGHSGAEMSTIDLGHLAYSAYTKKEAQQDNVKTSFGEMAEVVYQSDDNVLPAWMAVRFPNRAELALDPEQRATANTTGGTIVVAIRGTSNPAEVYMDLGTYAGVQILQALNDFFFPVLSVFPSSITRKALAVLVPHFIDRDLRMFMDNVTEMKKKYPADSMVFTGHSLGGMFAEIAGPQLGVEAVTWSAPGNKWMQVAFNLTSQRAKKTVQIKPRFDPIATVDTQLGVVQPIECRGKDGGLPADGIQVFGGLSSFSCHGVFKSVCELWRACSDDDSYVKRVLNRSRQLTMCSDWLMNMSFVGKDYDYVARLD